MGALWVLRSGGYFTHLTPYVGGGNQHPPQLPMAKSLPILELLSTELGPTYGMEPLDFSSIVPRQL